MSFKSHDHMTWQQKRCLIHLWYKLHVLSWFNSTFIATSIQTKDMYNFLKLSLKITMRGVSTPYSHTKVIRYGYLNAQYIVLSLFFHQFGSLICGTSAADLHSANLSSFVIHMSVLCHLLYQSNGIEILSQAFTE